MRTEALALLSALFLGSVGAVADETSEALAAIEDRYRESLVRVHYRQQVSRSTAEPPEEKELTTTGVIVAAEGLVMVSAIIYEPFNQVPHGLGIRFPASVARAEAAITEARVELVDGSEYPATLLGRDPAAGVAFFQIQASEQKFTPVAFRPQGSVPVGEQVVVVSLLPDPIGPAVAVELSRVQARTTRPEPGFMVATTASDPVGSLVVSLEGEILGYLDALTVPVPETRSRNPLAFLEMMRDLPKGIGRGFARPAERFVDAGVLVPDEGPIRRAWLGIEMQALSKELATHMKLPVERGILLSYVYEGSPAERAGLAVGDVLVGLDGEPIQVSRDEDIGAFAEAILRAGPGAGLELSYVRDGRAEETTTTLVAAPRSAREARTLTVDELDLTVRELTYDYTATHFLDPDQKGVVVVDPPVPVSSNPNRIAPGDLLVRIGDRVVQDLEGFREVVEHVRATRPDEVVLFVERGRESFFFAVKPEWN